MAKDRIRKHLLDARAGLSPERVETLSRSIQDRVLGLSLFRDAEVVALYSPVRNEVLTSKLLRAAVEEGKRVIFPAVAGAMLVFREVASERDLVRGAFGIAEPSGACREVDCGAAGLVVVPGVAFDRSGRRVGYGKGFYDRALHRLERTGRFVGLCYGFQLVADLPAAPHDVEVDLVVTEDEVIPARNNSGRG